MYQILRQQRAAGKAALSMDKLDKYMQNQGRGQFNYEVFKSAYDSDEKIQDIVKNFDEEKIELKTSEIDDLKTSKSSNDSNNISKMAKRATDL